MGARSLQPVRGLNLAPRIPQPAMHLASEFRIPNSGFDVGPLGIEPRTP